ncbi:polyribonucleotide nucleotidyltransferase [Patescibacteria group bacterium AH-259-L07]|nr:polyribonucleotide nucleotidyltransferase [Patescibacteria group bacterium AH-259-L07]
MEFSIQVGGEKLNVTIGEVAGQANGSCVVQYGETTVLGTAVIGKQEGELDYFPLTVEYEERFYAAGKIKGSRFIKRETRPPDEAVLADRLIDRSIRPLFNSEGRRAVQVVLTVLSVDQENDPDIVALYAASIALAISDIEWEGPVAGVRVSRIPVKQGETPTKPERGGEWVLNPSYEAREKSDLDLVVCGKDKRVIMLETGANKVEDERVFEAVQYGVKHFERINRFISEIVDKVGKEKVPMVSQSPSEETPSREEIKKMTQVLVESLAPIYLFKQPLKTKEERIGAVENMRARLEELLLEKQIGKEKRIKAIEYMDKLIYQLVSRAILDKDQRIDGRALDELRPISCSVAKVPRVHGSALFSRGETQVLSAVTLGAPGLEQYLDTMEETGKKRFMHHYNFPPFSVGEARPMRFTSRREIGHGALVEKGCLPILPEKEEFPHTIRIVSEVVSSNGSSSMASACASILAAMDAGIPITQVIAGVAIGLASEEDENGFVRYKVITDIQDLEDGPGGMDFKVIGTENGVTAIQMDTKTKGLTLEIIQEALTAGTKARKEILEKMTKILSKPRATLSPYAPRVTLIKIDPEKIRDVVGPGGRVINEIINKTGVEIDIEQDGTVYITSQSDESISKAADWVKDITRELKVGEVFQGRVARIMDFGAFVELVPGQDGLVHVSKMAEGHIRHPSDAVSVGDVIPVEIIEIDQQGRINLTMVNKVKGSTSLPQQRRPSSGYEPRRGQPKYRKNRY